MGVLLLINHVCDTRGNIDCGSYMGILTGPLGVFATMDGGLNMDSMGC